MADEGDTVVVPITFHRSGVFDIRVRIKTGTNSSPTSTSADYSYRFNGDTVVPKTGSDTENDKDSEHVAWGIHTLNGVIVEAAGVHKLQVKCLKDWSCLLDWLAVTQT